MKDGRNTSQKNGSFYYGSPERKQYRQSRTEEVSEKIVNSSTALNNLNPELKASTNAPTTLVHKFSQKNTIGGKTTAKKKSTFNYKEGSINNSNIKSNNKFFTASKFGYDENILESNSKAIITAVPFNLDSGLSGIPDSTSERNSLHPHSNQKVRSGGVKMQDRDFTIRKKKSRKEVEFLIGSRGMSENRTLIASNSKKEDRDIISPFIIDNGFEISEMSPQLRE